MASKKQKTVQQILLVWGIEKGWSVIPKSVTQERIEKNFEIDGWTLDEHEMHVVQNPLPFFLDQSIRHRMVNSPP